MPTGRGLALVQRQNADVLLGNHALLGQRGRWRSQSRMKIFSNSNPVDTILIPPFSFSTALGLLKQ